MEPPGSKGPRFERLMAGARPCAPCGPRVSAAGQLPLASIHICGQASDSHAELDPGHPPVSEGGLPRAPRPVSGTGPRPEPGNAVHHLLRLAYRSEPAHTFASGRLVYSAK